MSPRWPSAPGWPAPAGPRRSEPASCRVAHRGSLRSRCARSPNSSGTGRRRMASAARSGPSPASPRSSKWSSESAITRTMSAGCIRACTGRRNSRSGGPPSGTTEPSSARATRPGRSCSGAPAATRRALVFEDESGFYLLPGVVKTYAPEGGTAGYWGLLIDPQYGGQGASAVGRVLAAPHPDGGDRAEVGRAGLGPRLHRRGRPAADIRQPRAEGALPAASGQWPEALGVRTDRARRRIRQDRDADKQFILDVTAALARVWALPRVSGPDLVQSGVTLV